ncbi:MAG: T9SS type A sorting domain-containing protein [Bacteroidales bacterium]|nr:T9SS type A sorting domain-containing protein [Bacteroidales bacterium]
MRKIVLLFLIVSVCSNFNIAKTQDNIELFAEIGTEWSIGNFSPHPTLPREMIFMKLTGDTIINDIIYYTVYENDYHFSDEDKGELAAFVRLSDYKLYLRTLSGLEWKVFDYSLEYEDYAYLSIYDGTSITVEVCGYNTVNIFGHQRKKWELCRIDEDYSGQCSWIEGIGPSSGILYANFLMLDLCGANYCLICAHLDGELIYQNPDYNFCEFFVPSFWDRFSFIGRKNNSWSIGVLDNDLNLLYTDSVYVLYNTFNEYDPNSYYYDYYYWVISTKIYNLEMDSCVNDFFYAKIYADSLLYVKNRQNEEHVIFDFTAQEGDTLDLWSYDFYTDTFYPITGWIENTDSVFTSDGTRKSWQLTNNYGSTTYIKGLGNDEGLLRMNFALTGIDTSKTVLICTFYNNTQIYQNPDYDTCSKLPSNQNINDWDKLSNICQVYPNPTNNIVYVETMSPNFVVEIYNMLGDKIYNDVCLDTKDYHIDMKSFPVGIYMIKVSFEDKIISQKIVKK